MHGLLEETENVMAKAVEEREARIDRYTRDYSARTLAEMLVDLEDITEHFIAKRAAKTLARIKKSGERLKRSSEYGKRKA